MCTCHKKTPLMQGMKFNSPLQKHLKNSDSQCSNVNSGFELCKSQVFSLLLLSMCAHKKVSSIEISHGLLGTKCMGILYLSKKCNACGKFH